MTPEPTALDVLRLAADLLASGYPHHTVISDAAKRLGCADTPAHNLAWELYDKTAPAHYLAPDAKLGGILHAIRILESRP